MIIGNDNAPASPVQSTWLAYLRDRNAAVTFYLRSGLALHGRPAHFDQYTLLLDRGPRQLSLIYKHAVSTVRPTHPAEPFDWFEAMEPPL